MGANGNQSADWAIVVRTCGVAGPWLFGDGLTFGCRFETVQIINPNYDSDFTTLVLELEISHPSFNLKRPASDGHSGTFVCRCAQTGGYGGVIWFYKRG